MGAAAPSFAATTVPESPAVTVPPSSLAWTPPPSGPAPGALLAGESVSETLVTWPATSVTCAGALSHVAAVVD